MTKRRHNLHSQRWLRHLDRHAHLEGVFDVCDCGSWKAASTAAVASVDASSTQSKTDRKLHRRKLYKDLWSRHGCDSGLKIFSSLQIDPAGGLQDEDVDSLWESNLSSQLGRYVTVFNVVVVGIASLFSVIKMNIDVLTRKTDQMQKGRFLLLGAMMDFVCEVLGRPTEDNLGEQLLSAVELMFLLGHLANAARLAYLAIFCKDMGRKWQSAGWFFWFHLQYLCNFTAMKLLTFVAPDFIVNDMLFQLSDCIENCSEGRYLTGCSGFVWFIMSRLVIFVIGYDSMITRVRQNMDNYMDKTEFSFDAFYGSLLFLFQILGVVNVTLFVRMRLCLFLFGGQDCVVDNKDKAVEWFWHALLVKRIRERHSLLRFFIIMISFSDTDFQSLVLLPTTRTHARSNLFEESVPASHDECNMDASKVVLQSGADHVPLKESAAAALDLSEIVPEECAMNSVPEFDLQRFRVMTSVDLSCAHPYPVSRYWACGSPS